MKMTTPPGTVCCFMCKGMVIYRKGDKSRFHNHMGNEHGVVFEIDFLFAACNLNEGERSKVKDVIEKELLVKDNEHHEFNEESVKKQLRKIIPVPGSEKVANVVTKELNPLSEESCKFCDKHFNNDTTAKKQFFKLHVIDCEKSSEDDDIEVIKSVSAAEKTFKKPAIDTSSNLAELDQNSKKRKLNDASASSIGVGFLVPSVANNPSENSMIKKPAIVRYMSSDSSTFRVPSINPTLPPTQTTSNFPFLVPNKSANPNRISLPQTPRKSNFNARTMQTPMKALKTPMKNKTPPKNIIPFVGQTPMKLIVAQTPIKSIVSPTPMNSLVNQTPRKSLVNQTPRKSLVNQTPRKSLVNQTPMMTPRKNNQPQMVPPSTVKKRNSGYAPSMFPCDECDKGYASRQSMNQHKKKKHVTPNLTEVNVEKKTEVKVEKQTEVKIEKQTDLSISLPLPSRSSPAVVKPVANDKIPVVDKADSITKQGAIVPDKTVVQGNEPVKFQLFTCDGCAKSYQSSMKLKMHKKRSCKVVSEELHIKLESGEKETVKEDLVKARPEEKEKLLEATLEEKETSFEETLVEMINPKVAVNAKTREESSGRKVFETEGKKLNLTSETDEIQSMLMLDNADDDLDDDDDDDEDIEVVDIVDKTASLLQIPIGKIKNETQIDSVDPTPNINDKVANESIKEQGPSEIGKEQQELNFNQKKYEELKKSKYFMEQPTTYSKCSDETLSTFQKELSFLPGWKKKKNEIKKKNGDRIPVSHFLSPENIVIRSSLGVLEYLRLSGYKEEDLKIISLKLKVKEHNLLTYLGKFVYDL